MPSAGSGHLVDEHAGPRSSPTGSSRYCATRGIGGPSARRRAGGAEPDVGEGVLTGLRRYGRCARCGGSVALGAPRELITMIEGRRTEIVAGGRRRWSQRGFGSALLSFAALRRGLSLPKTTERTERVEDPRVASLWALPLPLSASLEPP